MQNVLNSDRAADLAERGVSRRNFGRILALLGAGATMPFYNEAALAQFALGKTPIPPDAVRIDLNENPQGPCQEALAAMCQNVPRCGRYLLEATGELEKAFAAREGLRSDHVAACGGSSMPLHHAVLAFTGPQRPVVLADPGYDAILRSAQFIGSRAIKVPLRKSYAHDVRAMAAAASQANAGLVFVCNPNNPTGTLTPQSDIDWLAAHLPKGTLLVVDEAYIQYSDAPPSTHLVAEGKDVILLRTFSKLYGMAALRAGIATARPDLLAKVRAYTYGPLSAIAMIGARVSLGVPNLVAERRQAAHELREEMFAFLEQHGFDFVRSVACMFMVDVRRPGAEIIQALRKEKIYIGRTWPAWPTHVRVSLGTRPEMDHFKTALLKVIG
jgi:histidinol-phosphate aminotransferase